MAIGIKCFIATRARTIPENDPVVRVNMSRLREQLVKRYATINTPPRLRIELPKGLCAPQFVELGARRRAAPRFLVLPFLILQWRMRR